MNVIDKISITPRQIKIFYFRYVLIRKILLRVEKIKEDEFNCERICELMINKKECDEKGEETIKKVVKMVVAY